MSYTTLKNLFEFKFEQFNYFGVFIEAYTNEDNKIVKSINAPSYNKYKDTKHYFKDVYCKERGEFVKPNAISIDVSKHSIIDVDKPEQCPILDRLLNDCNFIVKTRKGYHFYFKNCESLSKSDKGKKGVLCDVADINIPNLFFCPIYCHRDDNKINFSYELIKNKELNDMPEYAIMWCNMLIMMKNFNSSEKTVPKVNNSISRIEKIEIIPDIDIQKFDIKTMELIYDIYFKYNQFNDYDTWRDIAYMSRHLNNTEECFKLFDMYSRKVESYKNKPEIENRQMFFGKGEYNVNFDENGVLVKCAKLDIKMYDMTLKHLYKNKYEDEFININSQYLYTEENKHIFNDWNENYKCLMLKSAYGTGKTFAFKQIIESYNPKRILFITYRQSLAHSLIEDLQQKFGFDTYLDKKVNVKESKRLIIQLDSIKKLENFVNYNFDTQTDTLERYNLIVLDEMEGLLNHLSYEKIEQHNIFDILRRLLYKSKKILCLDGDLSDRSLDFVNNLKIDYKVYRNQFQPNKKNFIFTENMENFNDSIDMDLKNGKKIVIVCMTKTESEKYNSMYKTIEEETDNIYNKYKGKYRVIIHNSIEKNKQILLDVNKYWAECDILIYSPSVESGVDFNVVNHFYKCYALLSNKSTSYRAFNQMLNRVRYYENNDVLCYFNKDQMEFSTLLSPYRFNEIKLYKYANMEETPLINVLIHNDVEYTNSRHYFIPSLIKSILSKGHTYQYLKDCVKTKKDNTAKEEIIYNIANAQNITNEEYENLLLKQKNNEEITRDENNMINKMYYKKVWQLENIEDVSNEFLETHYNKIDSLKNNKLINIKLEDRKIILKEEILKKIRFEKIDMFLNIIKTLGFNIHDKSIKIDKETLNNNEDKVLEIINSRQYKNMFGCKKAIVKKEKFSINSLLDNYGLKIYSSRNRVQKGKVKMEFYEYTLNNLDYINKYYERVVNQKQDENLNEFLD